MLKVQEIRELIRLVDQSNIDEFKYESDGIKLSMKKNQATQMQVVDTPVQIKQDSIAAKNVQQEERPTTAELKAQLIEEKMDETKEKVVVDENLHKIISPMVGTFYSAPSPDAEPYVKVGTKVKSDSVVCIVEAMKLFNEIEADIDGEIVEVLVQNGQLVEFGQPLFLVKVD
ncbi:acetyl-CoA carboxylase biotin carboxyl carrier protein [Bacillus andreraoultii]|uniref:acetyl-CoA carboxylase biotin carboxyl carrier protein n=1 Tax=Bacillus andreraoultii TaxID=1499685 RepID=UPI00053AD30D|nr:acetyl-CoA carboxylase biotin carboxyl carrier protein [Bacillus andreraoultii]